MDAPDAGLWFQKWLAAQVNIMGKPVIIEDFNDLFLKLHERLGTEEMFERAGVTPEQRLAGLDPEQRLAGLDPDELVKALRSMPKDVRELIRKTINES